MNISHKHVLLTGAGSGIGRVLAGELARAGARLILTDLTLESLQETIRSQAIESQVITCIAANLCEVEEVKRCADEALIAAEYIDILYCNAGMMCMGQVMNMPWQDFEKTLQVNQVAPIFLTHYLLSHLKQRSSACIAYTCSASALASPPSAAYYSMSKAALFAFSESIRAEVAQYNINVLTVCPGFVHTPLVKNITYRDQASKAETTSVPWFIGCSPERVAKLSVLAIQKNKQVVTTGIDEKIKRFFKFFAYSIYSKINLILAKRLLDKAEN